ncbi:hypothetical protein ACFQRK_11460 [Parapedobacter sp. GCM10030251]|uniref:hypothetical protein n=1 Tax=Parapedobacter sp. GCM10030251 TaxID=3273419 RepID=UPI003610D020
MKHFLYTVIYTVIAWQSVSGVHAQGNVDFQPEASRFSVMKLSGTDALGRRIEAVRKRPDDTRYVGVFYSVWLGQHHSEQQGIYDIQRLLDTNPSALKNPKGTSESPLHEFHFWGEPLYGYYSMSDPWIVTRHIELLTNAAIDYLCIDATNNVVYESATKNLLDALLNFQRQGFDVPKVVFYTNSSSGITVAKLYDLFYKSGMYETLWFKPGGKPLMIGITERNGNASDQTKYAQPERPFTEYIKPAMNDYFDVRESQWPNGDYHPHSIPWMSWQYPQRNHSGTVAVPVAQHSHSVIYASSMDPECSRGYNNRTKEVERDWTAGANFETMWDAVFASREKVDNVLATSFNEWMAIKYANDAHNVFFVDVYNNEFSRDIEMMKGGYNDNFYLQLVRNVRKFKFLDGNAAGGDSRGSERQATYVDFAGDARPRDFSNATGTGTYVDTSNRNDITEIHVSHDDEQLYFRIKTQADITPYNGTDLNWMNILVRSTGEKDFAGYQYIINRKPGSSRTSVERSIGGYEWVSTGEASYKISGNVMEVAVSLEQLGLTPESCAIEFKVADHVTKYDDIMDYYVTGDSAPLGRLSFRYGNW